MLCQLCEEEEAILSLIPTGGDGLPQIVGLRCLALIGLQTAKDNLPAEEIAAALGPMFVTPASEDLHDGAAKRRASKRVETPKQRRERRQALGQLLAEAGETEAAQEIEAEGQTGGTPEIPATGTDE